MSQRLTLTFATVAALSAGTNYAYSSWAPQLASRLHLSSKQLNVVGAAGNAGVYLSGPLLGILVDKKGPRSALLIGAVALFIGYFALYAMYSGGEDGMYNVWGVGGLALAELATGIGSSAGLSGAVNGVSKSFSSKARGRAMAVTVAGFGLSAFAYSTLSHTLASADPTASFLLLLALGTGASQLLGAIFVRPVLHGTSRERSQEGYLAIEDPDASPLSRTSSPAPRGSLEERQPEPVEGEGYFSDDEEGSSRQLPKERDAAKETVDIKGRQLLLQSDFWLLFAFLGLCSGIGLMYINNLGTIIITLANDMDPRALASRQSHFVSLLSICNCLGRLAVGFAGDYCTHHAPAHLRFARIWWYVPIASLFILSQFSGRATNSIDGWRGLTMPTALTGFAYGALFAKSPVVCLERFGLDSFSTNNGILTLAPSVFGNGANMVFGWVYDSNVDWSEDDGGHFGRRAGGGAVEHVCRLGPACFAPAFTTTIAMSLGALAVAVTLGSRASMRGS